MANINEFKIVKKKSSKYFNFLENELKIEQKFSEEEKHTFGFYLFVLEYLTNVKDNLQLIDLITDADFNTKILGNKYSDDLGIDAINIDEENDIIQLFNFKYKNKFNTTKPSQNNAVISSKLLTLLNTEQYENVPDKIKEKIKTIIEKLNTNNLQKIILYLVTNSNHKSDLQLNDAVINGLQNTFGVDVEYIALDEIINFISLKPSPLDAKLIVDRNSLLKFEEDGISSSSSYVIKISLDELVRITSTNQSFRQEANLNDPALLNAADLDLSVLFDNVRGFIVKSKYNKNIANTLENEPTKFFLYNNGITLTVKNIQVDPVQANKKFEIKLENIQVLNGGQTLRTIDKFKKKDEKNIIDYLSKAEVLVRVFEVSDKEELNNKIAEFTNSQNTISVIDLKSLRQEQLQIEQFLKEHNILYIRKFGDTGEEDRKYDEKINMETFGKILFSFQVTRNKIKVNGKGTLGAPHNVSNQKKAIFDKYYDEIFCRNFNIEKSIQYIKKYIEIRDAYISSTFDKTEQKIYYILYMYYNFSEKNINTLIGVLEEQLQEYKKVEGDDISSARKLIQTGFLNHLNQYLIGKYKIDR